MVPPAQSHEACSWQSLWHTALICWRFKWQVHLPSTWDLARRTSGCRLQASVAPQGAKSNELKVGLQVTVHACLHGERPQALLAVPLQAEECIPLKVVA